jgi:hypothetical protein
MTDTAIPRFSALAATVVLAAALLLIPTAHEAEAQSLLSAGGLGMPTDAPDARSRMLGGVGIGMSGSHLLPHDPAAAGRVGLPGISATMEIGTETPEGGERARRTLFPSIGVIYPHGGNVFFATFSGALNQEWEATAQPVIDFGDREVRALDVFRGRGGISAARLGMARPVTDRISVGASIGSHVGSIERDFRRDLNPSDVGTGVEPFTSEGIWRARGLTAVGGVSIDVSSVLRVAGSVTWSDDLELSPSEDTDGESLRVPMPTELRVGSYATVAPGLGFALSLQTADWTGAAGAMGDEAAPGRVWQWGAGLEWMNFSWLERQFPVALGYRQRDLPFSFLGDAATERAFTGGFGAYLSDLDEVNPLARLHLGLEVGSRTSDDWEESFFRTTVTLRLSGG